MGFARLRLAARRGLSCSSSPCWPGSRTSRRRSSATSPSSASGSDSAPSRTATPARASRFRRAVASSRSSRRPRTSPAARSRASRTSSCATARPARRHSCRRADGADGAGADGDSAAPSISPAGRFVAFESDANNLSAVDDDASQRVRPRHGREHDHARLAGGGRHRRERRLVTSVDLRERRIRRVRVDAPTT